MPFFVLKIKRFCLKMKIPGVSKDRNGTFILVMFSDSLSKNTLKKHPNVVTVHICSIPFNYSWKSLLPVQPNLHVYEKNGCQNRIQRPKKKRTIIILINCVFQFFLVTQYFQPYYLRGGYMIPLDFFNITPKLFYDF